MTGSGTPELRISEVDLGPCRATRFDQGSGRWTILLPGARYPTSSPLFWVVREAAMAAGLNALAVTDTYDGRTDPYAWATERAEAAIRHVDSDGAARASPLLVAKSITTLAAPLAARLGLPAVWLTPLFSPGRPTTRALGDGLAVANAPFLIIGGTADPEWDGTRARSFPGGRVLEIPDADHSLQIPGNLDRSFHALRLVHAAIGRFIATLDGRTAPEALSLVGLDHVQLAMPPGGEAEARKFYASILGLREVAKPEPLAARGGCWFVGAGVHLHLGVAEDFRAAEKAHPAFLVADLEALRDRLRPAGSPLTEDDSLPGVRRFYTIDPFGNRLEFVDAADGTFTERPASDQPVDGDR